jgi:hypothetical protein
MTDLEKQAEELGIKVDKRWSEDRLQQEIDKALSAPKVSAEKMFPVKLVKNYRPISPDFQIRDEEGDYREPTPEEALKVPAGSFITLPVKEAQAVVTKKIAERNDPIG